MILGISYSWYHDFWIVIGAFGMVDFGPRRLRRRPQGCEHYRDGCTAAGGCR